MPNSKNIMEVLGDLDEIYDLARDAETEEEFIEASKKINKFNEFVDSNRKWHERWFERAKQVSTWSKDPSTKIGAVFVDEKSHRELSAGYNGFPRGIKDDERLNNREIKYKLVVHGEMNGIFNAVNNGVFLEGSSLYVWGLPICSECAKGIIQVGVKNVYVKEEFVKAERWKETWELTQQMFKEAGIKVFVM